MKWPAGSSRQSLSLLVEVNRQDAAVESTGSITELEIIFHALPAKARIEVAISAVSNGGESAKNTIVVAQTL